MATPPQRLDTELLSLRRAVRHAFTRLAVGQRKWIALSAKGKEVLTACANSQTSLERLDSAVWPMALDVGAVNRSCAIRVLRSRSMAQHEFAAVKAGLLEAVRGMQQAVVELEAQVTNSKARNAPLAFNESGVALLSRAQCIASAFEHELMVRSAVGLEVAEGCRECSIQPGWDASLRLYLAAWMLEPCLDLDIIQTTIDLMSGDEIQQIPSCSPRSMSLSTTGSAGALAS